jgi:hypothetical protein
MTHLKKKVVEILGTTNNSYATRKFQEFHPILLPFNFTYKVKRKIRRCSEKKKETEIIWKNGTSNVSFRILDITNVFVSSNVTAKRVQDELHPNFPFKKEKTSQQNDNTVFRKHICDCNRLRQDRQIGNRFRFRYNSCFLNIVRR